VFFVVLLHRTDGGNGEETVQINPTGVFNRCIQEKKGGLQRIKHDKKEVKFKDVFVGGPLLRGSGSSLFK
jgi:hypothetical protein